MRRTGALVSGIALALCLVPGVARGATQATLRLQQVLGRSATGLVVDFGGVDAMCISTPVAGVTCAPNVAATSAVWYGSIAFQVQLSGMGGATARLTGVRRAGGTLPTSQLLDGPSGAPGTPYPIQPAAPIALKTAIGGGNTTVTRSIGIRVMPTDAAGTWTTFMIYTLVVE